MALVDNSAAVEISAALVSQREENNNRNPPPLSAVENSASEISQREENNSSNLALSPRKRMKDPEVRVKNGRIYDSENGKSCHQCRQKIRDFAALCKKLNHGRPCPLTFCHKCLLNRYGEKVDEVRKLEDWICPRCCGVCNCSICMKRKGYQPTGMLTHTAKASGYNSVLELLHNKGTEVLEHQSVDSTASPKMSPPSIKKDAGSNGEGLAKKEKKEKKKGLKRLKCGDSGENQVPGTADGIVEDRPLKSPKIKKSGNDKKHELNEANMSGMEVAVSNPLEEPKPSRKGHRSKKLKAPSEISREDIVLPRGRSLTKVAGIELSAEDAGAALQFLEFCNAFSEVLDIRKGQPECVLRDLTRGRVKRHGVYSASVEFNIKLLSLIEKKMKKDGGAWLQTLKRCIEDSECVLEELPLDFLDRGLSGYENLESSEKLKLLNFLCDEVLGTEELRNRIDEVAAKFDEKRKENTEIVVAAKKKEKLLKEKMKDETIKAMLSASGESSHSLAEFDDLRSQLQIEADKVHIEVLACLGLVPKKNQRSDAVRTDHVKLVSNGQIFWKLSGYNNSSNIILQDIGSWHSITPQDKWFVYNEEEEKVVEKYISSLRNPRQIRRVRHRLDAAEWMKSDSSTIPDSPGSEHCLPQDDAEQIKSDLSDIADPPGSEYCLQKDDAARMRSSSDIPGPLGSENCLQQDDAERMKSDLSDMSGPPESEHCLQQDEAERMKSNSYHIPGRLGSEHCLQQGKKRVAANWYTYSPKQPGSIQAMHNCLMHAQKS